ncbi:MAG TPA: hypothetical protein VGH56_03050, partial [Solirubrobacteraceae bacterium]
MRFLASPAGPRSFVVLPSTRTRAPVRGIALRIVAATEYFVSGLSDSCQSPTGLVPSAALS